MSASRMGWMVALRTRLLAAATLALALGAAEARADFMFELSGVTFDDGTLATGTFTTNDALDSLISFDITTTDGAITGFHYTPTTAGSGSSSLPAIIVLEPASLDHIIQLTFTGLTSAGAPITIGQFDSFEQDSAGTHRQVVSGSVVAASSVVPEPSSLLMCGVAATAGLGLWARRRRAG